MSAVHPTGGSGRPGRTAWRRQFEQRWQAFAPRERQLIAVGALAVLALLVWSILVQPALRTLREAPLQIAAVEAELQAMQAMAAETASLRSATPVPRSQAVAALTAATEAMGPKGRLVVQGDRAVLTLNAADTDSLRQWLELARSAARTRPVEAQWTRTATGYTGTLIVSLGGGS